MARRCPSIHFSCCMGSSNQRPAVTSVRAPWNYVIQPFGCPESIPTADQYFNWSSFLNCAACMEPAKIQVPHHPQAIERLQHTILTRLSSLEGAEETQWSQKLPKCWCACNMFGRHARLPVDYTSPRGLRGSVGWVTLQHVDPGQWDCCQAFTARDEPRISSAKIRGVGPCHCLQNCHWREQGKLVLRRNAGAIFSDIWTLLWQYCMQSPVRWLWGVPEHTVQPNNPCTCPYPPEPRLPDVDSQPARMDHTQSLVGRGTAGGTSR